MRKGMRLQTCYSCFPTFAKDLIDKVYYDVKNKPEDGADDNVISVNCS